MKNPRNLHHWLISVLIVSAIAVICLSNVTPLQAQTCDDTSANSDETSPCFADNNDILSGQRDLLPDDDLVVNVWKQPAEVNELKLDTSHLAISSIVTDAHTYSAVPACTTNPMPTTQSVAGRVFYLVNDVVARVGPTSDCSDVRLIIEDPQNANNFSALNLGLSSVIPVAIALADFNQDGYQDIFLIDADSAQVFSAKCTNDPLASCTGTAGNAISDGLSAGPAHAVDTPWYASPPVTGDFNGDGIMDVAWPTHDSNGNIQVKFMSVCPSANATVLGETCTEPFEIVESTFVINTGGTVNLTPEGTPRPYIALTANNFDGQVDPDTGIAADELLVALASSDNKSATLSLWEYGNSTATSSTTIDDPQLQEDENHTLQLFLASGPLNGSDPQHPLAVFASTAHDSDVGNKGLLSVITVASDLTLTPHNTKLNTQSNQDKKTRIFGMAVGRFDPPDPNDTTTDFNWQIAALVDHKAEDTHFQIFTINFSDNSVNLAANSDYGISTRYYDNTIVQVAAMQAGDLQGRSLLLGAPSKTTVGQTQPDMILGVPPMHVDFIAPQAGESPQVVNVSVFPNTFNAGYDFETTTGTQASHSQSTSYTISGTETVKAKISYGVPDVDSVTAKLKLSATQTHQKTVSATYDTYSGQSYQLTDATGFEDLVSGASFTMNIYSYPVIGRKVCPSGMPNCSKDQMVPEQVQYSGSDNITYISPASAGVLEWYQPVTEPGNIFSYPGSLALLEAGGPQQENSQGNMSSALDLLTSPTPKVWDPQSTETETIHWSEGTMGQFSSGSVNTYSFEQKLSVREKSDFEGVSASLGFSVDLNESTSISTLNTSSQTFAASSGVTLNKGIALSDNYEYQGQSFIYGLQEPTGTIQTDLTVGTDVATHGRIEVAHVADMLSVSPDIQSGDWWKQVYTAAPDVALNHPERWGETGPPTTNNQEVMFNCPVGFTSSYGLPVSDPGSCTSTTTQPTPANVADASFYRMKGLFIMPGTSTTGPTTMLATLGDTVTLQARVYNYSLANMPADTTVHVRFYAQPWDTAHGQFEGGSGAYGFAPAVFIGEDVLDPIPAFCGGVQGSSDPCTDGSAPLNWTLAQVSWDTSTLNLATETNWKFWVVAWMQDSSGNLVNEIAQHGLTGIPIQDVDSLADVPVETYSNNLGFYNQVFTLELPTAGTAVTTAAAPDAVERQLAVEPVEGFPSAVLRDRTTTLRIRHRAYGGQFDYVRAFAYDNDPWSGGKLIDMDIIPRVSEGTPFVTPFRYHPRTCGPQTLFLEAVSSDGGLSAEGSVDVTVTLDPKERTQLLIAEVKALKLKPFTRKILLAKLRAADRYFRHGNQRAGLGQLNAFANELRYRSWKKVPAADAMGLIAQVDDLKGCLYYGPPKKIKKYKKIKKTGPERRREARR